MIRPLGRWTLRHVFWLPFALCLWPLVMRNYRLRERGILPDRWYWADRWLVDHGFVVMV
jgi:hypothetical protein